MTYKFGKFEVDTERFELRHKGGIVEIRSRAFDVLAYLVQQGGRIVSRRELLTEVWDASVMSDSTVPTCIVAIRQALSDDPDAPTMVETVRGRGYRFIGELYEVPPHRNRELDSRSMGSESSPFVGREHEMALLCDTFEQARVADPQLVLLEGEPGIGKSRTAEEFVAWARDAGACALVARCREGEGAPGFWPWVQVVRSFVEHEGAEAFREAAGRFGPVISQMVPDVASEFAALPAPQPLEADQARFRLFEAVGAFIRGAARSRPLVLVFDDLHCADLPSLLLLRFVARNAVGEGLLLAGTYRPADAQRNGQRLSILTDLVRGEGTRIIPLGRLSRDHVSSYLTDFGVPEASVASLADRLFERSGGNPFFLTQLVLLLQAEGRLAETGVEGGIVLPDGIREAIVRQLDGLPESTRDVLLVAAVAGREFTLRTLESVLDLGFEEVLEALETSVVHHLVELVRDRPERYRFAHVLLRDALYEEVSAAERTRLHREIGNSLKHTHAASLGAHAAEIAHHLFEAAPGYGVDDAITHAICAADWATERLAYEDAPAHLRRALEALELSSAGSSDAERCNLLLKLGAAEIRAAEREAAQATLKEAAALARAIGSPDLLAQAALSLAPGFFAIEIGVFDPVLVGVLQEALDAIGPEDSELRARLLARLAMALVWSEDGGRGAALTREAVDIARRLGDPATLAFALSAHHGTLWSPDDFAERTKATGEFGAWAERSQDVEMVLMQRVFHITELLEQG